MPPSRIEILKMRIYDLLSRRSSIPLMVLIEFFRKEGYSLEEILTALRELQEEGEIEVPVDLEFEEEEY